MVQISQWGLDICVSSTSGRNCAFVTFICGMGNLQESHNKQFIALLETFSNLKSWESFRLSGSISSSRIYKQCQTSPANFLSTSINSYPPTAGGKFASWETQGLEHEWSLPGKKPELHQWEVNWPELQITNYRLSLCLYEGTLCYYSMLINQI